MEIYKTGHWGSIFCGVFNRRVYGPMSLHSRRNSIALNKVPLDLLYCPQMSASEEFRRLLHGPYEVPRTQIGRQLRCLLRGSLRVRAWSDGRIPWPIGRIGHGGRVAIIVTPELARAIRLEAASAVCHWWGFGINTVTKLRRRLDVSRFNDGTLKLYSLWKKPKLPDLTIPFDPKSLRRARHAKGMTCRQVANGMGWNSINSYGQMEEGRRRRALPETLRKLAKVFSCRVKDLQVAKTSRKRK